MNVRKPNMIPSKTPVARQPVSDRLHNMAEVELGYTEEEARAEAERCLNCPDRYCAAHCPAHTAIPEFIAEIRAGNYEKAYEIIACTNCAAGIASRVCPQECQCESHCTRGIRNEPVAIGRLERFVCDWHERQAASGTPAAGRSRHGKIAVVGGGPAGMTCALSLAKAGFRVTILEKEDRLGGVLAWGIPSFVLPAVWLEKLVSEVRSCGVDVQTGVALGRDVSLAELKNRYDAVFVATGAGVPVELPVEGAQLPGVMQAEEYLKLEQKPQARHVVVVGGGNTAVDVARCALRAGAEQVRMVYRRTQAEMPATREEIALALEEGVELVELSAPLRFLEREGVLSGLECSVMELAAPDYPGGRRNVAPSGQTQVLDADLAVLALGFRPEPVDGLRQAGENQVWTDKRYATSEDGVYAGGDVVTGAATLMKAVAAGKDAAAAIFERLI